ncbi:hypothetical protein A2U01_0109040, partial [Trifolium medium]|nr:hypothetical protein [Trifolium medium]
MILARWARLARHVLSCLAMSCQMT